MRIRVGVSCYPADFDLSIRIEFRSSFLALRAIINKQTHRYAIAWQGERVAWDFTKGLSLCLSTIRNAKAHPATMFFDRDVRPLTTPLLETSLRSLFSFFLFYFRFDSKALHHLRDEKVLTGKVRRKRESARTRGDEIRGKSLVVSGKNKGELRAEGVLSASPLALCSAFLSLPTR